VLLKVSWVGLICRSHQYYTAASDCQTTSYEWNSVFWCLFDGSTRKVLKSMLTTGNDTL